MHETNNRDSKINNNFNKDRGSRDSSKTSGLMLTNRWCSSSLKATRTITTCTDNPLKDQVSILNISRPHKVTLISSNLIFRVTFILIQSKLTSLKITNFSSVWKLTPMWNATWESQYVLLSRGMIWMCQSCFILLTKKTMSKMLTLCLAWNKKSCKVKLSFHLIGCYLLIW